jgi:hypothetical protein
LIVLTGGSFLSLGVWVGLERARDPWTLLDQDIPAFHADEESPHTGEGCPGDRRCQNITLAARGQAPIRIALSLPADIPPDGVPVVVVLGGYRTGRRALKYVQDPGLNAVITYDYPLSKETWSEGSWIAKLVEGRAAMHAVPGQVLAVVRWARAQPWAESARISLVGYSLGALFVPVTYRVAQAHGETLGPGIIAFGGAHLYPMIRANLHIEPEFARDLAAWFSSTALHRLEPAGLSAHHRQG